MTKQEKYYSMIFNIVFTLIIALFQIDTSTVNTVKGTVLDMNKNPIPFAHIGVSDSNLGTVADEKGEFSFNISSMRNKDTLYISSIGYSTKKIGYEEIRDKKVISVTLMKKRGMLKEVVIEAKKQKEISYGLSRPYWFSGWVFSGIGNGNEVGRIFRNTKNIEITKFRFHLKTSDFDSSLYRINIQELENEKLSLVNKKEIFVRSTQNKGWVHVNVSDKNIITNNDFLITIELLKGWINGKESKRGKIVYSAKNSNKDETYIRPHKFSDYEKIDLVISMHVNAYVLE